MRIHARKIDENKWIWEKRKVILLEKKSLFLYGILLGKSLLIIAKN